MREESHEARLQAVTIVTSPIYSVACIIYRKLKLSP